MPTVLLTGASGFIGSRLLERLDVSHDVIAFSRPETNAKMRSAREADQRNTIVHGNFTSYEDLQALNSHRIDVLVHLAADLGDSEDTSLSVNVLGTRTLLRYLIDRNCKRFVLASSIAVAGGSSEAFVPRQLPIPDDYPCEAIDPYGISKALMEEIAFYHHRLAQDLEFTLLRLGAALDVEQADAETLLSRTTTPFIDGGGMLCVDDGVEAFALAVEKPLGPGARRFNVVGDESNTSVPVPEALEESLGNRVSTLDMEYYRREARERASLYSTDAFCAAYGFQPATRPGTRP